MKVKLGPLEVEVTVESHEKIDLVRDPLPGGPNDEELKASTAEEIRQEAAFEDEDSTPAERVYSRLSEDYFEAYVHDPDIAYQMVWQKVHLADELGFETKAEAVEQRLALGVGAFIERTGTLGRSPSGLVLTLEGGGVYRLSDRAVPYDSFGPMVSIKGIRQGYDRISNWQFTR